MSWEKQSVTDHAVPDYLLRIDWLERLPRVKCEIDEVAPITHHPSLITQLLQLPHHHLAPLDGAAGGVFGAAAILKRERPARKFTVPYVSRQAFHFDLPLELTNG
jgi:hypothetical protein